MPLTPDLIIAAMNTNAAAGDTETQAVAHARLANAIINTIKEASLVYTVGLISASPGSPVTGSMAAVTIE